MEDPPLLGGTVREPGGGSEGLGPLPSPPGLVRGRKPPQLCAHEPPVSTSHPPAGAPPSPPFVPDGGGPCPYPSPRGRFVRVPRSRTCCHPVLAARKAQPFVNTLGSGKQLDFPEPNLPPPGCHALYLGVLGPSGKSASPGWGPWHSPTLGPMGMAPYLPLSLQNVIEHPHAILPASTGHLMGHGLWAPKGHLVPGCRAGHALAHSSAHSPADHSPPQAPEENVRPGSHMCILPELVPGSSVGSSASRCPLSSASSQPVQEHGRGREGGLGPCRCVQATGQFMTPASLRRPA